METFIVNKNDTGLYIQWENNYLRLQPIEPSIIHLSFNLKKIEEISSEFIEQDVWTEVPFEVEENSDYIEMVTPALVARFYKKDKKIHYVNRQNNQVFLKEGKKELSVIDVLTYSTGGEKPVVERVKTVDGERSFIKNLKSRVDHQAYRGKLYFDWKEDEGIYGLGQAEEGIYNYRGNTQYLYQHNMRIPMPMFYSDAGYGILFDCGSLMTFNDGPLGSYMFFDTIKQMDYYIVLGPAPDKVISGFRKLTGRAAMLPRWAFGYVQSKEQYYTAEELEDVVRHYRNLNVPIDCIVQDWNTWEPGKWGEKLPDKSRYDDLKERIDHIHDMNVHTMVSVWPNMNAGGENHSELFEAGCLLNDYSTYNAFDEKARDIYWNQAKKELFNSGFDSWWCDSTEPFSGPDWDGEVLKEPWERYYLVGTEHKKYLDYEKANLFALMHAKGIYEHQRKEREDMRVLNLTRSGYASGQKYGAMLWSGDITATYDTMKKQIIEGLNMGLSGYPYWTLDIGGFFVVNENWEKRGCGCSCVSDPKWFWKGGYENGVDDPAYRELYTRWLQMGTFLPMFRSHGTDTPREIWNFGKKGDMFYDAIEKFINLRYALMPYIYSLAGGVHLRHETMMRSLLFDFNHDKQVKAVTDQFMFGPSLMICPVTHPMYFEKEGKKINVPKERRCYLPEGCGWYDFFSGGYYDGGQEVAAEAPINKIPIFVKAGSIIPMRKGIQYADERADKGYELYIYPGENGKFTLYEDDGNSYGFESGQYALTDLTWNAENKKLTISQRYGGYEGMPESYPIHIYINNKKVKHVNYAGNVIIIDFPDIPED